MLQWDLYLNGGFFSLNIFPIELHLALEKCLQLL